MKSTVELVLSRVPGLRCVLEHEPEIKPDLAGTSVATILAIMLCLIEEADHTTTTIHIYLEARGCVICFSRIESLLREFEGSDPKRHLWEQQSSGIFYSLYSAALGSPRGR